MITTMERKKLERERLKPTEKYRKTKTLEKQLLISFFAGTLIFSTGFNAFAVELERINNATEDITFASRDSDYTFTEKVADIDNGGAISSTATITFAGTNISFINNSATNDSNNTSKGNGGAIYTFGQTLNFLDGNISFDNNTATRHGGAINTGSIEISGENTTTTFSNNTASNSSKSSHGGAISVSSDMKIRNGKNIFSNNQAQQQGGAIDVEGNFIVSGGNNTFDSNSANHGGAIYSGHSIIEGGTNKFINNSVTTNGGAIFAYNDLKIINGENIFLNNQARYNGGAIAANRSLTLTANSHDMIFQGNTAADGNPNAVYILNDRDNNNIFFSAKEGKSILFYDPIESVKNKTNFTIYINNDAEDTGTIFFDTYQSNVYGNTTVHNGIIQLNNGASYGADTNPGIFTLNSGSTLLIGVNPDFDTAKISNINAETITFTVGSAIDTIVPDKTSTKLTENTDYTILNLNATSNLTNSAEIVSKPSTVTSGAFDYNYEILWNTNKDVLNLHTKDSKINPETSGSNVISTPGAIELSNPTTNVIGQRQNTLFDSVDEKNSRNLWITPFYNFKQMDYVDGFAGYKIQTPGVVIGYDKDISDNSFLGILLSLSWPDYYRGNASAKGDDFSFGIYGGTALNNNWELTYLATYGKTDLDQHRYIGNNSYSAKYDSDNLHMGIGIAKKMVINEKSSIRPYVKYEYLKINPDSYTESGSGTDAIHFKGDTQDINIIRAGFDYQKDFSNKGYFTAGLFYLGQFGDTDANATAFFLNDPNNSFRTYNIPEDRDNLGLTVGTKVALNKSTDFRFNFTSLMGSHGHSNNVDVTLNYKF